MDRGEVVEGVAASGTVQPVELIQVGTQISGTIQKLFADFNSKVTANQPIALLDARRLESQVAQDEASLAKARAEADSLRGLTGTLIDSLVRVAPDSLSPFVLRLRNAWMADLAARDLERVQADSALAVRDLYIMHLETAYTADLAVVRAQLAEAIRQLGAANERAAPGFWRRALRTLPWAGGAYIMGRLTAPQ